MKNVTLRVNRCACSIDIDLVDQFITAAKTIALKHEISILDVLKAKEVLEYERHNDLTTQAGDHADYYFESIKEFIFYITEMVIQKKLNNSIPFSDIKDVLSQLKSISDSIRRDQK